MAQRDAEHDDRDEITPTELGERLARGEAVQLIDVREPNEHVIARIEGARLIPLRSLPQRSADLDRETEMIVFCHHGMRSAQAVEFLRGRGFERARNLTGGIDRWSVDVDPAIPRY
jgi:adenylyltransferase/sulfurtransferase